MTLEEDIVRANGGFFRKTGTPKDPTEMMTADLLKGMTRAEAEKRFFANMGAYVVGKMRDLGITATSETFLTCATRLAATMNYLPLDRPFFEKAVNAAIELGYVRLEQGNTIPTMGKGPEAFEASMKKEARYN